MGEIMTITDTSVEPRKQPSEQHPRVQQFRASCADIMEQTEDNPAALELISELFATMEQGGWVREAALLTDLRRISHDDSVKGHMMASLTRSAAREMETSARHAGALHHYQAAESRAMELVQHLTPQYPEIADQIRDALAHDGDVPPRPVVPSVLSLMVDTRHAIGWFTIDGASNQTRIRYPFVGWATVVDVTGPTTYQGVQAAFSVGGTVWPLCQLLAAGYHLSHLD